MCRYVGCGSLIELDVHLFVVGTRVGVSPMEIFDWVLGWFTLDPVGDDQSAVSAEEAVSTEEDE